MLIPLSVLSERSVFLLAHRLPLGLPSHTQLGDPAIALRIFVQRPWLRLQSVIDLDNSPANRREDVGGRLDRLDSTNCLARVHFEVDLWELDVDNIAEGFGSIFRDTEGTYERGVSDRYEGGDDGGELL